MSRKAVIIGAGPAGLTAAYELLRRSDARPVILEMTGDVGGISRTVEHHGNRMDIGGHRFFSKSDRVVRWWLDMLPLQGAPARDDLALGRSVPLSSDPAAPDPEKTDRVMLVRRRLSRIVFRRRFFDYPLRLNPRTLANLGAANCVKAAAGYAYARLRPVKPERSLADFVTNRFGGELYRTFFRDYTEKVWGVSPTEIPAEWGAQRIKSLSVARALAHAVRSRLRGRDRSLRQRSTETSLIEQFMYPKLGPGQLWREAARRVADGGGEIHLGREVTGLECRDGRVTAAVVRDRRSGAVTSVSGDVFLSSMPVRDLIGGMAGVPADVARIAGGLRYRDFVAVGLLLRGLETGTRVPPDNWLYVQEPDVRLGRVQVFNNWSPYLVADPGTVWLGLEYFCNEGDDLWRRADDDLAGFAAGELEKLGLARAADELDHTVVRMPKAYPAYFGTYAEFGRVREYLNGFANLFLIGRNGMHRYNNQDHSMVTAMLAAEQVAAGTTRKDALWNVNLEREYHESGAAALPEE